MSDEALIAKIIKDFENTETVYTGEVLPGLCDESCRICIYASTLNNNSVICNYILVTGNRRGCAAGSGCGGFGTPAWSISTTLTRAC